MRRRLGSRGTELVERLDKGTPRILIAGGRGRRPNMMSSSIGIMPYMMQPGDYKIVAESISKYMRNPGHFENPPVYTGATANLAGTWNVTIKYVRGIGQQQFVLEQSGTTVSGQQKGEIYNATFKGNVEADHVTLMSVIHAGGYEVPYTFAGVVSGNTFAGGVKMGEYGGRNVYGDKGIV